jgi:hypothetical protein
MLVGNLGIFAISHKHIQYDALYWVYENMYCTRSPGWSGSHRFWAYVLRNFAIERISVLELLVP